MEIEFYKKIIRGEGINSLFIAATKPLTLVNGFVLLKFLSLRDFGLYNLVLSFQSIVSGFSINFLDTLVLNEMNIYNGQKQPERARSILREYSIFKIIVGLVLTLAVYGLADRIGLYYGPDAGSWIRVIAFLFIIENTKALVTLALEYRTNFLLSASYDFFYEVIKLVLIVVVFKYTTLNVQTMLILSVATHLLIIPFLLPKILPDLMGKSTDKATLQATESLLARLIKKYGPWAVARYYLLNFTQNVRPWVVKYFVGVEGVAIFSVALNFLGALKGLISFNSIKIFLPRQLDNEEKLKDLYIRGGRYVTYAFFGIFLFGATVVPILVNWILPKYSPSLPYFFIVLASMLFFGVQSIIGQILYSVRRQKELFFIPVIGAGSIIFFNLILTPTLQLYGIALEFFLTQLLMTLAAYYFLLKEKPNFRLSFKSLLIFDEYDKLLFNRTLVTLRSKFGG